MKCPYCAGSGSIDRTPLAKKMLAWRARRGIGTREAAKVAGLTSYTTWGRAERGLGVLPSAVVKIRAAIN